MFVYSGSYRLGVCGEATPLIDLSGKNLFVGDIVITSTIDEKGICFNTGLTVISSDRFTSYSNGTHVEKEGDVNYFAMGISNVDFMGVDADKWSVQKVKSFDEVIEGEHWENFGFNYKNN